MRGPAVITSVFILLWCLAVGTWAVTHARTSTTTALQVRGEHQLSKRAWPSIEDTIYGQRRLQLRDAFKDAIRLAREALASLEDPDDLIFTKYFNEEDRETVRGVLRNIVPDGTFATIGNAKLGNILIRSDFQSKQGKWACDGPEVMAEMRNYKKSRPHIVICEGGFKHGGLNKGYPGGLGQPQVQKIDCEYVGDRVTWRMETLGSILLHEYTHMKLLVSPPLRKETDDYHEGYGPFHTRFVLDKTVATENADSYSWFAMEAFWTDFCYKQYGDPEFRDRISPHCSDNVCTDTLDDSQSESDPSDPDYDPDATP